MSNRKDTLDIKSFVFESEDLKTLEEKVNVYIQKNRIFEIESIDFSFSNFDNKYMIQGVFNPTNMKKEKSDIEVRFFTAKEPHDSVGMMNRFLLDKQITGYYVRGIETVQAVRGGETAQTVYVTALTFLKPDRSHNTK